VDMSGGKVRYEVTLGVVLLVVGLFACLSVYITVYSQIMSLGAGVDIQNRMLNSESLLIGLSIVCLSIGALGGYLIGKYRHT